MPTTITTNAETITLVEAANLGRITFLQPAPQIIWENAENKLNFSYGDATPAEILTVSAGETLTEVSVAIYTTFNGVATLTVGDSGDISRLFPSPSVDLATPGVYTVFPVYTYGASTTINLYLTIDGATTQGSGAVFLTKA